MWGGTLIQFVGLAIMPFALLVLSGRGQVMVPDFVGQAAAGMAFLLVGAGLQTSQTAGLALATDQASEETRPRVVALLYTMLLVGAVSGSLIFSVLLSEFTPEHLVQVVQGSALVVLILNAIALWKQEPRDPQRAAALKNQVQPKFREVWAQFIGLPKACRFLWATALGTVAFNMQDIILEPYGGEILKLSVGATSALTAMLAAGGLIGFYVSGRQLAKGIDPMRLAAYGTLAGLPAFSAVIFSAPLDAGWLFRAGALGIGFGGGLFAVGTLFTAMRMEGKFVGLALGAWGAVQSAAAGMAMFFGGALRDLVSGVTTQGLWGPAMTDPSVGYSMVYHVEMLFLFITLVAIGPLVKRRMVFSPVVPPTLGLAELRT
jgi:BCD family chlorophyll transporter-like MFS transporter